MYAAELVPVDLLVFVAVLVDDFFAIKLFHYHVPVQCGCRKTFELGLTAIVAGALRTRCIPNIHTGVRMYVAVLVVTPQSVAFVFVESNYMR